jgi:MFS family permease
VISAYFICYSSGAIATRFIGGRVADRVGERRVLPYSILLYIAGLLTLPLTYNIAMLCVAGGLSGVGHGLLFPVLNTLAVRGEPAAIRGKATGIFTGGIDTGIFAGSFLLGYIGNSFNLNLLFMIAGLTMASGFLAMFCLKRHPLNEEQQGP